MSKNRSIWIAVASLLWASDGPIRTKLVDVLPVSVIVFFEHLFDSIVAVPFLVKERYGILNLNFKHWLAVLYLGVFASGVALWAFSSSFAYVSPSVSLILQKLQPIFVVILSAVFLRERHSRKAWILVLFALIFSYFVTFGITAPSFNEYASGGHLVGGGLAILASLLWGGATVVGKTMSKDVSYKLIASLRFVVGFVFMLLVVLMDPSVSVFAISLKQLLFIALAALVSGVLAMYLYYWALAKTSATIAAVSEMVYPVLGVVINWIFLGQRGALDASQIVASVLLIVCVAQLRKE